VEVDWIAVRDLSDAGLRVYVHSLNGPAIERRLREGIWGVSTNSECRRRE